MLHWLSLSNKKAICFFAILCYKKHLAQRVTFYNVSYPVNIIHIYGVHDYISTTTTMTTNDNANKWYLSQSIRRAINLFFFISICNDLTKTKLKTSACFLFEGKNVFWKRTFTLNFLKTYFHDNIWNSRNIAVSFKFLSPKSQN